MVSTALVYWLLLGLFQDITQEQVEDQDCQVANQGIQHSLRNGVITVSLGGLIITVFSILDRGLNVGVSYWLSGAVNDWNLPSLSDWLGALLISEQNYGLSIGLWMGVSGCCFVFLFAGRLAVLRHYVIRFLLWRSQTFPWRTVAFLDDATVRGLLRRVGGGYSFSHRLLLDYLADQNGMNDSTGV